MSPTSRPSLPDTPELIFAWFDTARKGDRRVYAVQDYLQLGDKTASAARSLGYCSPPQVYLMQRRVKKTDNPQDTRTTFEYIMEKADD